MPRLRHLTRMCNQMNTTPTLPCWRPAWYVISASKRGSYVPVHCTGARVYPSPNHYKCMQAASFGVQVLLALAASLCAYVTPLPFFRCHIPYSSQQLTTPAASIATMECSIVLSIAIVQSVHAALFWTGKAACTASSHHPRG